MAGKI